MTGASTYFSSTYAEARSKFWDAGEAAGARMNSHQNPASGPDGGTLTTDLAWFGPERPERVLLILSATHGAEGFLGSGIEVGFLRNGLQRELPAGMGLVVLHALNPFGFAWIRRTNETNIDLNRNFVDHAAPHPENPGYEALADAICPADWSDDARAAADAKLVAYGDAHGAAALQAAITSGQYRHADGVFYGGTAASWSNQLLSQLTRRLARDAKRIGVIDLHSGLGPYGHGEIINGHQADRPGFRRVIDWFGTDATSIADGTSSSAPVEGDTAMGMERAAPAGVEVAGVTLEYGTLPLKDMVDAVRADNWLHVHGRLESAAGRAIKRQIRYAFYPDQDDWKAMAWERAVDVARRMAKGLAES
jgi:predicted deacylase